mmetsp:Transcript_27716/g.61365  ORF Transcript_27716/g.61365 Transcript_27716/m.61365 type:complete len:370 (+) Transcript_27716:2565-3674(+)
MGSSSESQNNSPPFVACRAPITLDTVSRYTMDSNLKLSMCVWYREKWRMNSFVFASARNEFSPFISSDAPGASWRLMNLLQWKSDLSESRCFSQSCWHVQQYSLWQLVQRHRLLPSNLEFKYPQCAHFFLRGAARRMFAALFESLGSANLEIERIRPSHCSTSAHVQGECASLPHTRQKPCPFAHTPHWGMLPERHASPLTGDSGLFLWTCTSSPHLGAGHHCSCTKLMTRRCLCASSLLTRSVLLSSTGAHCRSSISPHLNAGHCRQSSPSSPVTCASRYSDQQLLQYLWPEPQDSSRCLGSTRSPDKKCCTLAGSYMSSPHIGQLVVVSGFMCEFAETRWSSFISSFASGSKSRGTTTAFPFTVRIE